MEEGHDGHAGRPIRRVRGREPHSQADAGAWRREQWWAGRSQASDATADGRVGIERRGGDVSPLPDERVYADLGRGGWDVARARFHQSGLEARVGWRHEVRRGRMFESNRTPAAPPRIGD